MSKKKTKEKHQFSVIEEKELARDLVKNTHFTEHEVAFLMETFKKFSNKEKDMDRLKYMDFLHNCLGMKDDYFMERVFQASDKNKNGSVTRKEFVETMSIMLRGTLEEKIPFCFSAFDVNDNLHLTRDDMGKLLVRSLTTVSPDEDPTEGILDIVEIFLQKIVKSNKGILTLEDYKKAVEEDDLLLEAFGPVLPSEQSRVSFLTMFSEEPPLINMK